ncbi:MAG: cytochrome P460 family protein [Burkholderiaceae bacterium]
MTLIRLAAPALASTVIAGCALLGAPAPKDGELPLPASYRSWPKFLSAVQRPDVKQVREIYMNPESRRTPAAGGFANGTLFVMESFAARTRADGTLESGPDGKLVKGELQRIGVMGKGDGWGQDVPQALRNGSWVYAQYLANGEKAPDDLNTCRSCHLPVADKDYVHRYDEHFASR